MRWTGSLTLGLTLWLAVGPGRASAGVAPDEILLVVNARIPAGRALAEMYARGRHIPEGRIVELDIAPAGVANPPEEIAFADYEPKVARPVRDYLTRSGLNTKVRCVVTFWGVPLRIGRRTLGADETAELASLKSEMERELGAIASQTAALETSARQLDPRFEAGTGGELGQLIARLEAAVTSVARSLPGVSDPAARNARFLQLISATESLLGSGRATLVMAQPALAAVAPRPPTPAEVDAARAGVARAERALAEANGYEADAGRRKAARELARKPLGALGYASVLASQINGFRVEESESALDSELALLWWRGYPRARWVGNPLHWRAARSAVEQLGPALMVTRIDGPSEPAVRKLIGTSLEVEGKGLTGRVVVDARGKPASDPYGQYDQTLRNLAQLLRAKTALAVTFDDAEALIPAHSVTDPIALYCGWYSLRNYAPPGPFAAGAVGFHVASFEMVSLRNRGEHGWVRGLLSDGVCATVGPVAEPYLQSFPAADEFFPLLLTGKLTLAEVYWRTTPMASWMQDCVGDPLYTPFKNNPALKVEDLPAALRGIFAPPATVPAAPSTQPAVR